MHGILFRGIFSMKKARKPGPIFIGGGENRTLVLSKLYTDDYMLSA